MKPVKSTARWDDWTALAAGLVVAVSWIWHQTIGPPTAALFLLGVAAVFMAVLALTHPDLIATEAVMIVVGLGMIVAPWALGFTGVAPMAWTAWILGAVIVAMGAIGLPQAIALHRRPAAH
ncbi:SPW repeat protein [Nocardiopsis mangrovi]|uniref:SPW repeat protein n=1 Tax=Nocardiopsis mangrovi TaxID=1179818 RepID=A0ABV9DP84_9ACTN